MGRAWSGSRHRDLLQLQLLLVFLSFFPLFLGFFSAVFGFLGFSRWENQSFLVLWWRIFFFFFWGDPQIFWNGIFLFFFPPPPGFPGMIPKFPPAGRNPEEFPRFLRKTWIPPKISLLRNPSARPTLHRKKKKIPEGFLSLVDKIPRKSEFLAGRRKGRKGRSRFLGKERDQTLG